jgi:hypothetical protein
MTATRTSVFLATAVSLAAVGLTGCGQSTMKSDSATYDITGPLNRVDATSRGGNIVLVAGTGNSVTVTETVTYTSTKPRRSHSVTGQDLVLVNTGCGHSSGNCSVDYRISVPAGPDIHLDSGGGKITVQGGNDSLDLRSGGGAVVGDALTAGVVDVHSAGGAARLGFTDAPTDVDVESGGGDATLRLPAGPYALTTKTGGVDATLHIASDPTADRTINVDTGGGTLTING